MRVIISRLNSTRKQDGNYDQVYEVDVAAPGDCECRIAPTGRDLLLEVARLFRIDVKTLELR